MSESHRQREDWHQRILTFAEYQAVETAAVAHIGPGMTSAEASALIDGWFYIRKGVQLRVRYRPRNHSLADSADEYVDELLSKMRGRVPVERWSATIYEPEIHAFGGPDGMRTAHTLFHHDSRGILDHLARTGAARNDRRRELSILLCSTLFRNAGQEWFEQGDVWARVADARRDDDGAPPKPMPALADALKRLMMVDTGPESTLINGGSPEHGRCWFTAFEQAGRTLGGLANSGALTRGLRAVLAHHVIFHWNRLGLPATVQGRMAATAREVILGDLLPRAGY